MFGNERRDTKTRNEYAQHAYQECCLLLRVRYPATRYPEAGFESNQVAGIQAATVTSNLPACSNIELFVEATSLSCFGDDCCYNTC